MSKPTVAIDFDGTMVKNAWPELGEWQPGAVEGMKEILKFANIVVWTCRISPTEPDGYTRRTPGAVQTEINRIRAKLDDAGLHDVRIWDHRFTPWKPNAAAYVDDKGIRFNGRRGAWKALVTKLAAICGDPDAMMYPGYSDRKE